MKIRRYTKADIPVLVERTKQGLQNFHYAKVSYDAGKVSDLLNGNLRNPTFFCHVIVNDDDEPIGGLVAHICEYMTSREVYAQDLILFVPTGGGHKFTDVLQLLYRYVKWAKDWGARQVRLDQSTGHKMEKFAALAKRAGFHQIGTKWNMEI